MKFKHRNFELEIQEEIYENNGRICLQLWDKEGPYATLTTNIPEAELAPGEFLIKSWSENHAIAESALRSGLFEDTGRRVRTGFVEAPVWRFKKATD